MGARIDAIVMPKAGKAAGAKAAGKKSADLTDGMPADFGQELAKAQPRKKVEAPPSEAVESGKASQPAVKPVKKGQGKREVEGEKGQEQQGPVDSSRPADQSVEAEEGEETPIAIDGEIPLADVLEEGEDVALAEAEVPQQDLVAQVSIAPAPIKAVVDVEEVSGDGGEVAVVDTEAAVPLEWKAVAKESPEDPFDVPAEDAEPVARESANVTEFKDAVRPVVRKSLGSDSQGDTGLSDLKATDESKETTGGKKSASVERFSELFEAVTADEPVTELTDAIVEKSATEVVVPEPNGDVAQVAQGVKDSKPVQQASAAPEVRFAEVNHPKVVTAVKTQLLPGGGSIQLRLDPPDLGPMRLEVTMTDGVMSASIVAATDKAAGMLSHSLGQLKHALEGAGISVDKLQVRQDSNADQFSGGDEQQKQGLQDQTSARQEQQRREMLNRMWRKVAGGDPLDLVA